MLTLKEQYTNGEFSIIEMYKFFIELISLGFGYTKQLNIKGKLIIGILQLVFLAAFLFASIILCIIGPLMVFIVALIQANINKYLFKIPPEVK